MFKLRKVYVLFIAMMLSFTGLLTGCEDEKPAETIKKTYNITFDVNGGTEVASQTVTEGETIIRPQDPEKEGYVFAGWLYGGSRYTFSSSVNSDMTLVAEWTAKEEVWVVTLNKENGSFAQKVNVKKGEKFEKPQDPEREGYVFVKWQLNGEDYDFDKVLESDITLTATWKEKVLKVTFNSDGGSSVKQAEIKYNGVVAEPKTKPTKAGWTFVEWQLEGEKYDFKTPVTSDIELMAIWKLTQKYTKEESITKKINKKDVKIDFRVYGSGANTKIDMFANDIKIYTLAVKVVGNFDDCNMNEACVTDVQEGINSLKEAFKVIKGDKEYLWLDIFMENKSLAINDTGKLIYNKQSEHRLYGGIVVSWLDPGCKNYDKFKTDSPDLFSDNYFANDGIYYLTPYTDLQIKESKITIKSDKVSVSTIDVCLGEHSIKGLDDFYIINKTKKVNNKDVNLEYRFSLEDDLVADLYINNKKVVDDVFKFHIETDHPEYGLDDNQIWPVSDNFEYLKSYFNNVLSELDNLIGIIKGDKEYLYMKKIENTMTSENTILYVFDSSFKIIFDKQLNIDSRSIDSIDDSCPHKSKYINNNADSGYAMYFIENDTLYYIEDPGTCTEPTIGTEYKVTFKNNKATTEKLGEYEIETAGACY